MATKKTTSGKRSAKKADRQADRAQKRAERQAAKSQKKSAKAEEREQNLIEREKNKARRKAEKDRAEAKRKAEREKEKAQRKSEREKKEARRKAEREKEKTQRQSRQAKRKAKKDAELDSFVKAGPPASHKEFSQFAKFLADIGKSMVETQRMMDYVSREYNLENQDKDYVFPTVFRIPKLTAELKVALDNESSGKLNVIVASKKTTSKELNEQSIQFEIIAAPLPPEALSFKNDEDDDE
ncbi:MAG: hypothetical protein G3M78_13270 [Candidatus Nitrohelix vancouverensis]|uniref:Uncharacterized protein n=1 Tax=Candidatus Nitrohelix vancouverensis TaxID=2705534 RepID=A0A7T0C4F9_9BACT|nr:MAG: hypothetical protein G3M78_13270 [Candidatus Nitrohelix vancouverensis]